MPTKSTTRGGGAERYWMQRIRSKGFQRDVTALIRRELKALGHARVADVVDAGLVRTVIQQWDPRIVDAEVVADLVARGSRHAGRRLRRRTGSLLDALDATLVADVDALLAEDGELSADAERLIANVMEQEFVRRLFTEIIFTAIVSFYQKVNPFFGTLAMRALEEQIKGFIRLFMPALQRQAIGFAVDKQNQRIVRNFVREIVRQQLDAPLAGYAAILAQGPTRAADRLLRSAMTSAALEALIREALLAVWEDLYHEIRERRVGELVRLEVHAVWLAERCVEWLLPMLTRPEVVRFLAAETAAAVQPQSDYARSHKDTKPPRR